MYEIKPILPKFDITIPTCMYQVKSLIKVDGYQHQNQNGVEGSLAMTDLEKRQENLLNQLKNLRDQLSGIRSQLGFSTTKSANHVEKTTDSHNEIFDDLVINASPDCIPYGLLALKNAWDGIFYIDVTVYSHSSVANLNEEAKEFQNKIIQNSNNQKNNNCPRINIVLIWKNSEHTEMITSSATYVPIYGEVNVLRYLARIGPNKYRYENDQKCNQMDVVLDISYQLPCCCGAKTKTQLLKSLNDYLQKQKFFGGDDWNIADIGAYSALKRSLWLTKKDLTNNLNNWYERIKLVTAF